MKRSIALMVAIGWLLSGHPAWAQKDEAKEHAELAKALSAAKMPLQTGLTASAQTGTPISAKYEVEDGKLQLSVYTMKGDTFSEVIVDHTTGKVAKVEPITGGEDFTAATAQRAAMAMAKRALPEVVDAAVKTYTGYRAVSIVPAVKGGHAVADIVLVKDGTFTTVAESLD